MSDLTNLVVASDLHCGSLVGLHPHKKTRLLDGGWYEPSPAQRQVAKLWDFFWQEWIPLVTKNEPFGVVINGDALDGQPHGSKQQVSINTADQIGIAMTMLEPIRDRCKGRLWATCGTEAHVGKSAENEELLFRSLGAVPDENGRYTRWMLKKTVGNAFVKFYHHVGGSTRPAYETSAPHARMIGEGEQAGRRRKAPPGALIFSHRHSFVMTTKYGAGGPMYSVVTPGWQGMTAFAYRIGAPPPDIGGILIRAVKTPKQMTESGEDILRILPRVWPMEESDAE